MLRKLIKNVGRSIKNVILIQLGLHRHLDSDSYIEYARKKGCKIGQETRFLGTKKLDLGAAGMIEIGENCTLTDRVRLVAHTSDAPVLQERFGEENAPSQGTIAQITIGDNVFVGENTLVLPGVNIGDHCIIGAGSVVADDVPPESVAAGNPCKVIKSLEAYREKCVENEQEMIRAYVQKYRKRGLELRRDNVLEYVRNETPHDSLDDFIKAE